MRQAEGGLHSLAADRKPGCQSGCCNQGDFRQQQTRWKVTAIWRYFSPRAAAWPEIMPAEAPRSKRGRFLESGSGDSSLAAQGMAEEGRSEGPGFWGSFRLPARDCLPNRVCRRSTGRLPGGPEPGRFRAQAGGTVHGARQAAATRCALRGHGRPATSS